VAMPKRWAGQSLFNQYPNRKFRVSSEFGNCCTGGSDSYDSWHSSDAGHSTAMPGIGGVAQPMAPKCKGMDTKPLQPSPFNTANLQKEFVHACSEEAMGWRQRQSLQCPCIYWREIRLAFHHHCLRRFARSAGSGRLQAIRARASQSNGPDSSRHRGRLPRTWTNRPERPPAQTRHARGRSSGTDRRPCGHRPAAPQGIQG